MIDWLKNKLTLILLVCLLGCGVTIGVMKCSLNSKQKKIEALNLQIKGFQLQLEISNSIMMNDRVIYEKKKKLLQELFNIGNDIDKLVDFLNRMHKDYN